MGRPFDDQGKKDAASYGDLINATYSMYFADKTNLTPEPVSLPAGWIVIGWIQMTDFAFGLNAAKFYGIVAQRPDAGPTDIGYAVAMRGTEGAIEWYDDAATFPEPFTVVPASGMVAHGFNKIYSTLKVVHLPAGAAPLVAGAQELTGSFAEQISQLVAARSRQGGTDAPLLDQSEPKGKFIVTGHSLGAALCTLYVMENQSLGAVDVDTLCTFASPRVGYAAFVNAFNKLSITSWRIANTQDIITKVPPELIGYRHVDVSYEFSSASFTQWNLGCWHDMRTYQHALDPSRPLSNGCGLTTTQMGPLMEVSQGANSGRIPPDAIAANVTQSGGLTTMSVTVTISTGSLS